MILPRMSGEIKVATSPCVFESNGHIYRSATNPADVWPGVTSIVEMLDKPYLMPWAAKKCAEAVKARRAELVAAATPAAFASIVDECKLAYRRESTEAKEVGTGIHTALYDVAGIGTSDAPTAGPQGAEAFPVVQFRKFLSDYRVEWLIWEHVVGSAKHRYGGTVDAVACVDGIPTLIDFKTSKQVSDTYALQTAGYAIALREMGVEVGERRILRLPKDGKPYEFPKVMTSLEEDSKVFLGLRAAHRWGMLTKFEGVLRFKGEVS